MRWHGFVQSHEVFWTCKEVFTRGFKVKVEQLRWNKIKGWQPDFTSSMGESVQLVLLFGSTFMIKEQQFFADIKKIYPNAYLFGCSTSGEICGTEVEDDSLVVTAVYFENTSLAGACVDIGDAGDSFDAGSDLHIAFTPWTPACVCFIDGLNINVLTGQGSDSFRKGYRTGVYTGR